MTAWTQDALRYSTEVTSFKNEILKLTALCILSTQYTNIFTNFTINSYICLSVIKLLVIIRQKQEFCA